MQKGTFGADDVKTNKKHYGVVLPEEKKEEALLAGGLACVFCMLLLAPLSQQGAWLPFPLRLLPLHLQVAGCAAVFCVAEPLDSHFNKTQISLLISA